MDKIGYKLIIGLVVLAGLVLGQREFFPKTEVVQEVIQDTAVIMENERLSLEVDSLKEALAVKPERVIVKVPVLKFRTDTVVEESIITKTVIDTITGDSVIVRITNQLTYLESIRHEIEQPSTIFAETIVLGRGQNKTVVKFRPKHIKEGEELYFTEAEFMEQPLGYAVSALELPKKIKFKVSSVHVLGISSNEDFVERFNKIVKSRNRM